MEVELPPELEELRRTARRFVERELEPWAEIIEQRGEVPTEVRALLAANGYLGMRVPETLGGGGLGLFAYCIALEELSRSHRVFTLFATNTSGNTPMAIARHGTADQQERYLKGLVTGRLSTAFALTEPEAGSDAAAIKTRAKKVEGGWVIDGQKHFISGGATADFVSVMAVTDPEKRARGGVTAFLVDRETPGFRVGRIDGTLGSDAVKLAELVFENCFVPDAAVLGRVGGGFALAMESLADGRLTMACTCIGSADRMLEMALAHAKDRQTFGKPLSSRQAIQWMLADSAVELSAARALTYETIRQVEAGANPGTGPSVCKLYCSEMADRVTDRAVQIHGGMGLIRGFPVERFYRDLRHYRIVEGASEIQRHLIARDLLGAAAT